MFLLLDVRAIPGCAGAIRPLESWLEFIAVSSSLLFDPVEMFLM